MTGATRVVLVTLLLFLCGCASQRLRVDPSAWLTTPSYEQKRSRVTDGQRLPGRQVFSVERGWYEEAVELLRELPWLALDGFGAERFVERELRGELRLLLGRGVHAYLIRGVVQPPGEFIVILVGADVWVTHVGQGESEASRVEPLVVLVDRAPAQVHVSVRRVE